jgi:RNA polymerase sigma-70 factor (ECF subfamily)
LEGDKKSVPFAAWLMIISRNLMIDYYRQRKEKISLDEHYETTSQEQGPERYVEIQVEYRRLMDTIARLPDGQRQVIIMRFIEDADYGEIASALKKSEGAVRITVHRALKELRARIEKGSQQS